VIYLSVLLPTLVGITLILDLSRSATYWSWLSIIVSSYMAASLWWSQRSEQNTTPKKVWEWDDEDPGVTQDLWLLRIVAVLLGLGIGVAVWFSRDLILFVLALIIFVPLWFRYAQLKSRQKSQIRQDEGQ
jgi:hypothetical protein